MGFSLEALVALPLSLTLLAQAAALAGPSASGLKKTAIQMGQARLITVNQGRTCHHYSIEDQDRKLPLLESNPQKIIEIMSLVRDLAGTIGGSQADEEGRDP